VKGLCGKFLDVRVKPYLNEVTRALIKDSDDDPVFIHQNTWQRRMPICYGSVVNVWITLTAVMFIACVCVCVHSAHKYVLMCVC